MFALLRVVVRRAWVGYTDQVKRLYRSLTNKDVMAVVAALIANAVANLATYWWNRRYAALHDADLRIGK